jgi:hypothetical protein
VVEFRFEPLSQSIGAAISAASLLVVLMVLVVSVLRFRRRA